MDYADGDIVNGHRFDAASNSWVPLPPPAPPAPPAPQFGGYAQPAPSGPPSSPPASPASTTPPPATPPGKKGLSKGKKIGIGVGVGVLAIIGVASAASSGSGGNVAANGSPSPTTTNASQTPASEPSDTPSDTPTAPDMTVSQQQAVDSAQSYLSMDKGFSQRGLMEQLTSAAGEGFSKADAAFAISYLHPDWNAQAAMSAKGYLDIGKGFSQKGLLQQLTSSAGEGFTKAQAVKAINSLNPDWNAQAVMSAKGYLELGGFSRASLLQQLTSSAGEGFTTAQAAYALKKVGL